jgi:pectinesterase
MAGGASRVYILIKPGTYHELICVKGTVPITLYGANPDATQVTIEYDNDAQSLADANSNPCKPVAAGTAYGTSGSTTFWVASSNFEAVNLTIANSFVEPDSGTHQAVAMATQGDKLLFQNVRVLGNQDTLLADSSAATIAARSYYRSSYIEGDTDFIFGRGVAVFDDCDISYLGTRKANGGHLAPSSDAAQPYGYLVINSRMVAGAGSTVGTTSLGRAYDSAGEPTRNGQAVIRNTAIGNHVKVAAPWNPSTQGRPFNAETNRLYEYKNTGPGAAP